MSAATASPVATFDDALAKPVSMRPLALLRILTGPIVLLHLQPFLSDAFDGHIYSDQFYEPYASWYPEAGQTVYTAILVLGAIAAIGMSLGLATRVTTSVTFGVVAYNLFLSTTHFHNNRAYLVIVLATLAVAPCGRELSLDAFLRKRRGLEQLDTNAPAWPIYLLRFECAAIYAASGMSKLLDPDWFGGTVTWMRVVREQDSLGAFPGWVLDIITSRDVHTVAAKFIVLTEIAIATGYWSRRTRYAAVWTAVVFHTTIDASASVQVFSMLGIAVLVIWAVPSTRDRILTVDPTNTRHWRLVQAVRTLDWLARFRIERAEPGSSLTVTDRDGSTRTGRSALAFALSRLPLTAWFALPSLLILRRA